MYKLHKSTIADLAKIAVCHQACFGESLSSKLGNAYAAKSLEWFLVNEHRFLYHVSFENKVVGYCGGFNSQFIGDGSTSGMLQYAMQTGFKAILQKPWLVFHPELLKFYPLIIRNIYKRLFSLKKTTSTEQRNVVFEKKLGLVVIGVHPEHRGKKSI